MKGKGLAILLGSGKDPDAEMEDEESGEMELKAMTKFMNASSPEEKLKAFKQLMKLCGDY